MPSIDNDGEMSILERLEDSKESIREVYTRCAQTNGLLIQFKISIM